MFIRIIWLIFFLYMLRCTIAYHTIWRTHSCAKFSEKYGVHWHWTFKYVYIKNNSVFFHIIQYVFGNNLNYINLKKDSEIVSILNIYRDNKTIVKSCRCINLRIYTFLKIIIWNIRISRFSIHWIIYTSPILLVLCKNGLCCHTNSYESHPLLPCEHGWRQVE